MSNIITEQCWPLQMPPTAKSVLISLADNANDKGHCWPSIDTISVRTCVSRRAVIDAIKWLEASHAIVADRSNGRHTAYQLTPENFKASEQPSPRTARRRTSADAAPQPVQMPHRSDDETCANAALVAVQMPHGCASCTGADAAMTSADAARDPCRCRTQPVQMPHTNRNEPSLNRQRTVIADEPTDVELLAGFIAFYAAYPRKVAKPAAWNAWRKLNPNSVLQAQIHGALLSQKPHLDRREKGRFIPHPATWLNNERWNDELPGAKAMTVAAADGRLWFEVAGFEHPAEAENARCHVGNYREFRDGKRIAVEAHA